jgi:hypothetical protein
MDQSLRAQITNPHLAAEVERRTRVLPVTDRCHPCFRNPLVLGSDSDPPPPTDAAAAASQPTQSQRPMQQHEGDGGRQLQLLARDEMAAGTLVGAYSGRVLTEENDTRETARDPTGKTGLQHAYTFSIGW